MEESYSALGYVLSGCVFYIFGLKWCHEYAKYWLQHREPDHDNQPTKLLRVFRSCQSLLRRHPLEGTLKLLATALGLAGTLTGDLPNKETVSPKVVHATIYLFFALSGLVDVLTFYFPNVVGDGLAKMALAQSFFIEGFLFLWGTASNGAVIYVVLASIVWTTSFAVILELVWPETKLLRAASTLLHASWLAHMVGTYQFEYVSTKTIALTFSWHFAAAFVVSLIIVAVTRSFAPKLRPNDPPEIPIYDYCHESDQRV